MRLIVISSPNKFESELKLLPRFFNCGLEVFHLRKPKFSYRRMNKYLSHVPGEYLDRIIIHTHHRLALKYKLRGIHITEKQKKKKLLTWLKLMILKFFRKKLAVTTSFHSVADLLRDKKKYHYVFLSPIFDSISKKNHRGAFSESSLKNGLRNTRHSVIALGGIEPDNISRAREFGFKGIAVLGSIWRENKDPMESFKEMQDACVEKKTENISMDMDGVYNRN